MARSNDDLSQRDFVRSTLDETLASNERFARDVMPLVGT